MKSHNTMKSPNILYLHSHDAGRCVSPLGFAVETPALMGLAMRGVCFRNAHTVAPTCSPSRSALLTGLYPHQNGMLGLAHFGFELNCMERHPANRLRDHGYYSALAGIQHITEHPESIGFDEILCKESDPEDVGRAAETFLAKMASRGENAPFFLDIGLNAPHRRNKRFPFAAGDAVDPRYVRPLGTLPDNEETRTDTAEFLASVQSMDRGFGSVLDALKRWGFEENTLVICTTDHGPPFPDMKCTLRDDGTGVFLIMAGPGVPAGTVNSALVANIDIYPTLLEAAGLTPDDAVEGKSLWPLIHGDAESVRDCVFGEINYHVSYEPVRSIRTDRWKYIRVFDDDYAQPILPNCDDGLSRQTMIRRGWLEKIVSREALYDLDQDSLEQINLIEQPECADTRDELRKRLESWMARTDDPLLKGPIPPIRPKQHLPSTRSPLWFVPR